MISVSEIERIADAVAERMGGGLPQMLTAEQVAELLAVDRGWVYDHADRLGAVRLGSGDKPRLRFDPARVRAALEVAEPRADVPPSETPRPRGRPRRYRSASVEAGR